MTCSSIFLKTRLTTQFQLDLYYVAERKKKKEDRKERKEGREKEKKEGRRKWMVKNVYLAH